MRGMVSGLPYAEVACCLSVYCFSICASIRIIDYRNRVAYYASILYCGEVVEINRLSLSRTGAKLKIHVWYIAQTSSYTVHLIVRHTGDHGVL